VTSLPAFPAADYRAALAVKLVITAIATSLLLWEWLDKAPGAMPRRARVRTAALAAIGLLSVAAWWNFNPARVTLVHYHEFFHYYLGSKYAPELGYTRLYDCVAVADAEQGLGAQASARWIRNLETNELRLGTPVLRDPDECRSRFTPARWAAFAHDVSWFRDRLSSQKWAEIGADHGYNATPVWNVAGYLLSNTGAASTSQIRLLTLIDPALLLLMWGIVSWAFGWRVACVAAVWWGTNFPARYTYIGGAFLRQDWLVLAVGAICFAKRGRMWLSGLTLTWSALLRIFPGFLVLGLLAKIVIDSYRARHLQISKAHWRFAGGAMLALLLWLPLSVTVGVEHPPDPSVWTAFSRNSRKHLSTPSTNLVGLPVVVSFDPSTRASRISRYWMDAPWDVWVAARRRVLDERFPWYVALATILGALLVAAIRGRDDWMVLTLSVGLIPVLTSVSCYYYGIFLVYAFLWPRDRGVGAGLTALSLLTCSVPAIFAADDDRYMVISAAIVIFVAATSLFYAQASRTKGPARASSTGAPTAHVPATS
jgi:hypothetical protein